PLCAFTCMHVTIDIPLNSVTWPDMLHVTMLSSLQMACLTSKQVPCYVAILWPEQKGSDPPANSVAEDCEPNNAQCIQGIIQDYFPVFQDGDDFPFPILCPGVNHKITKFDELKPINHGPYWLSPHKHEVLNAWLKEELTAGHI